MFRAASLRNSSYTSGSSFSVSTVPSHQSSASLVVQERRLTCRRPHKMDDPEVHEYVKEKLENRCPRSRLLDVFAVNSTGVFLGTKTAIEPMRKSGGGSVINVSSIFGIVGSPGGAAYHASKGAARIFSKAAAIQYAADKIRVNSVHPGFTDTPMTETESLGGHDSPTVPGTVGLS